MRASVSQDGDVFAWESIREALPPLWRLSQRHDALLRRWSVAADGSGRGPVTVRVEETGSTKRKALRNLGSCEAGSGSRTPRTRTTD